MVTTTSHGGRLPLAAGAPGLALALLIALPVPASAVDWLAVPSLRLRESYTDNALLAPPGQAQSDFITEIAPAIGLIGTGPRLQVHLDASWRQFRYQHRPASDSQELQASANAELLKDWFHLDSAASISEHSISPFGAQVINGLPPPQNASTVRTVTISPYLRHRFSSLGTAELRYTRNTVSSGGGLLSMHSDEVQLLLNGAPRGAGWSWNASYDARRTQDSKLAPQRMERSSVGLRYPFNSRWSATASAGQEKEGYADSSSSGKDPQGRFWSLGGVWTPSPRTSVAFSTGRRFFGKTYSLDAAFRQRHTSWSAQYSEDITTMPAQFLRLGNQDAASLLDQLWTGLVPDARERRLRIDAFLRYAGGLGSQGAINYFSHRYFLQKQLTLSMARATSKSTLVFGLNAVDRTAQTSSGIDSGLLPDLDFGSEDRTRQVGSNLGWTWQASPRSSVSANAGYSTIRSLSVPRRDNNFTLTSAVSRTIKPKMTASIELRHTRHSSTRGGAFRENGVSATLTMQF
ncbi:TIGR03016 family PEP-CTERM system-associated outer membrane protein [Janthinobacterium sp.]|uniref:TIGR03016 family PEP-CTERM system-associated outer membrane protein n=1 Tax=Janthinobacterium sp. TaxID=1871054 RepID=UPI00262CDAF1|nr:TIGR03016 family PEP-CTERM system-associated outer membrane protein [Janthinobacterium sp.]